MTQVKVFFGPPGTGKTTRLLEEVKRELATGVRPDRIAFVAFSRKAAGEARERARAELGLDDEDLRYWATLHSTAARQLGVGPGDLLTRKHWTELGSLLGMKFGEPDEAGRIDAGKQERGKQVQAVYSLARARLVSPGQVWAERRRELQALQRLPSSVVDQFVRTLAAYKAAHQLMDYPDLLDQAAGALPVDVLFLDEAQDLTPAQWDYVGRLTQGVERCYVAGDDDQAIYDWAGADVRHFLALADRSETSVLSYSHRLPFALATLAWKTAGRIRVRQPKDWTCGDRAGVVRQPASPEGVPIHEGEWLLLARTNAFLDRWEAACRDAGVPYTRAGVPSVNPKHAFAIRAWETWRAGRTPPEEDLAEAFKLAGVERADRKTAPVWREALIKITPARRRYYEACLRRSPRALTDPPRVTLSTIHGAKGGEADHVALLPDLTVRVWEGMREDPDAEHRVWYVACTRARQSLHVVRPLGDLYYRY